MQLFSTKTERLPMTLVLVGLLLVSTGLLLDFEYSLAFVLMIVGGLCTVFGFTVFALQRLEPPRKSTATSLSPKFISAGATTMMPAMPKGENDPSTEASVAEQSA